MAVVSAEWLQARHAKKSTDLNTVNSCERHYFLFSVDNVSALRLWIVRVDEGYVSFKLTNECWSCNLIFIGTEPADILHWFLLRLYCFDANIYIILDISRQPKKCQSVYIHVYIICSDIYILLLLHFIISPKIGFTHFLHFESLTVLKTRYYHRSLFIFIDLYLNLYLVNRTDKNKVQKLSPLECNCVNHNVIEKITEIKNNTFKNKQQ